MNTGIEFYYSIYVFNIIKYPLKDNIFFLSLITIIYVYLAANLKMKSNKRIH